MTLRKRVSKNVYDLETVRLTPHPPLEIGTALEARHYVATYALFRVSFVERGKGVPLTRLSSAHTCPWR